LAIKVKDGAAVKTITEIPLSGSVTGIIGFHDCQRFIRGQAYDSVYAIFAALHIESLPAKLIAAAPPVRVASLDPSVIASGITVTAVAVAAATIYSYGGTYAPLGIKPGFNCLYFFGQSGSWRAKMVPMGPDAPSCLDPLTDPVATSGKELVVHAVSEPGFSDADYPPVARWDWDAVHRQQYIGIKCGTAWCEVGDPAGFTPGAGFADPGGPSQLRRNRMIKGWYDQQFLATVSADGKTTPSRIRGTIFPDARLGDDDTNGVFKIAHPGNWVPVAQVLLEAPATLTPADAAVIKQYKDSLNFDATVAGGRLNTISLCHGTKSDCIPPGSVSTVGPCDGDEMWWAQIESTHGPTDRMYRCVVRQAHDHLGSPVPGTARWRWLASNEVTWKRCDNGCCELH